MKGWLLDTNVVSEGSRLRPDKGVERWLASLSPSFVFISVLTLAELDQGIEAMPVGLPRRAAYVRFREQTEREFEGRVLPLSDRAVRLWGVIRGKDRLARRPTSPAVDALFVATAIHHDLHLATRNVADVRASGASVFNPWTDDPGLFPIEG